MISRQDMGKGSQRHLLTISRREMPIKHLPTCEQCSRSVWVGRKQKLIFVAYFQVNELCYDNTRLSMCVMEEKTYRVGKNLQF